MANSWFNVKFIVKGRSKIDEFFECDNEEETVGEFIAHIIETKSELEGMLIQSISAEGTVCANNMPITVLIRRKLWNLEIQMSKDIAEKTKQPEDGLKLLMKSARKEDHLPKPK